jgi:hypothetical protein
LTTLHPFAHALTACGIHCVLAAPTCVVLALHLMPNAFLLLLVDKKPVAICT